MSNIDTTGVKRRRAASIAAIFALLFTLLIPTGAYASTSTPARGLEVTGVNPLSPLRLGPWKVKTSVINGVKVEDVPIWCINARYSDPGPNEMLSIDTLTSSHKWGPAELDLETPQAAWLLAKYGSSGDDTVISAMGYLLHVNFESPRGSYAAQVTVDKLVTQVRAQLPQVDKLAQKMVLEARARAVTGYEKGAATGDGQRDGAVNNIGVHPDDGDAWIAGVPVTAKISGPAVFEATGTNTWSGKTATKPISLNWRATGNGKVTTNIEYQTPARRTLTKFGADGTVQDMISYGNRPASDPDRVSVAGPSWKVIYDFQPTGSSQVISAEVSDGVARDTFTTAVDPDYGSGEWIDVDGKPVTVQYRATAYYAGSEKPAQADAVPVDAQELGSVLVPATGAGQKLEASFDLPKRGWVTWVWEVRKADQGANAKFVHADWSDGFGLDNETSRENFPFRPMGVSNVDTAKVIDTDGALTDTFTPSADPSFYDGVWTRLGEGSFDQGEFVPVTYRASVYFVSATELPGKAAAAPENAELVKSMTVVATEPDTPISANAGPAPKDGFYTWVWEVRADDQPAELVKWIDSGWVDGYGIDDETTSKRYAAQVDSTLSVRETKSGTYLVDDVWVTGLPSNHPDFAGGAGFKADVTEIKHDVLFFPAGVDPVEANRDQAEKIGNTVTIPAKNGFYPSVGDTSWIAKAGEDGKLVPGTYVFVTSFEGDDRVMPLVTSVGDKHEQFTITPEPGIHTALMYKSTRGAVPAGKVELVDQVAYTNLEPGKEYTLTGQIMVKSTGKPLTDAEGKPVETTAKFTSEKPNGTQDAVFAADLTGYAGEEIVAFEKLYDGDVELAVHTDINDTDQTLKVTKLSTSATDKADGDQVMEKTGTQSIVDKVCEHSGQLIPGATYTITTTLMQDNGKPVLDKDGQPVTVTTPFTPAAADECASVEISFDASLVQGSKVVVFEDVLVDDVLIGVHHDLGDVDQTITFKDTPTDKPNDEPRSLAFAGASTGPIALLALGLVGAGGLLIYRRKSSGLDA